MPAEETVNIVELLVSIPDYGLVRIVKIVFIGVTVVLAGGIIWLLVITDWLQWRYGYDLADFLTVGGLRRSRRRRQWERIKRRLERSTEEEWKLAVIEAEEFLDAFLERRGFQGDTLIERVQEMDQDVITAEYAQEIQRAYQTANSVIHDPDYALSQEEAERTVNNFEHVLLALSSL